MENIITGLIAIANGFLSGVGALINPWPALIIVIVVSFLWLAVVDIEELGRQSKKPEVRRH